MRTEVIYGGVPINEHITLLKGLKKPHIIVGTPGRVLALVKKGDLDLSNLQIFVLDECDKMLEEVGKYIRATRATNQSFKKSANFWY